MNKIVPVTKRIFIDVHWPALSDKEVSAYIRQHEDSETCVSAHKRTDITIFIIEKV